MLILNQIYGMMSAFHVKKFGIDSTFWLGIIGLIIWKLYAIISSFAYLDHPVACQVWLPEAEFSACHFSQYYGGSTWPNIDLATDLVISSMRHINSLRLSDMLVNKAIFGSDNGLAPDWCQAIILTNDGVLLARPMGTYISEFWIKKSQSSHMKIDLKMLSAKLWKFGPLFWPLC